jgi:hypothetical protein
MLTFVFVWIFDAHLVVTALAKAAATWFVGGDRFGWGGCFQDRYGSRDKRGRLHGRTGLVKGQSPLKPCVQDMVGMYLKIRLHATALLKATLLLCICAIA